MIKKTLIILLIFANLTVSAQNKKDEKELYTLAKKNKNSKTYLEYFEKYYPNGYYIEKAQKKGDDIVYNNALKSENYLKLCLYQKYFSYGLHTNNIEKDKNNVAELNLNKVITTEVLWKLKDYLKNHKGATTQLKRVNDRIDFLKHRKDYKNTINNNNFYDLILFLIANKKSIYYNDVLTKLYLKTKTLNKTENYYRFLELPNNRYTDEIQELLYNLEYSKINNTITDYENFIRYNNENPNIKKAKIAINILLKKDKEKFEKAKKTNTISSYDSYIINNLDGKFITEARELRKKNPISNKYKSDC